MPLQLQILVINMPAILDWIKYKTEVWHNEHEDIAVRVAKEIIWYRPGIQKRILRRIEELIEKGNKNENSKNR
jgi:hypothetical protein